MGVGLSLQLEIPKEVTTEALVGIGKQCCPHSEVDGMDVAEALQWAFSDHRGVAMLASWGVTWQVVQTGRIT